MREWVCAWHDLYVCVGGCVWLFELDELFGLGLVVCGFCCVLLIVLFIFYSFYLWLAWYDVCLLVLL